MLCAVCEAAGARTIYECCGHTEAAHVKTKGAAGGDWDNIVPLGGPAPFTGHHGELHRIGLKSFEYKHKIRLKALARKVTAAYVAKLKHG